MFDSKTDEYTQIKRKPYQETKLSNFRKVYSKDPNLKSNNAANPFDFNPWIQLISRRSNIIDNATNFEHDIIKHIRDAIEITETAVALYMSTGEQDAAEFLKPRMNDLEFLEKFIKMYQELKEGSDA